MIDALDLVRQLYAAINRSDLRAVAALYDPACVVEQLFDGDPAILEGRAAVEAAWQRAFARETGAGPAGARFVVHRISGIETGWGWARADWTVAVRRPSAPDTARDGYAHFWVEDGLIQRQRHVYLAGRRPASSAPPDDLAAARGGREYPTRPIVGVGAVVLDPSRGVLLIKRRFEPLAGHWSLPGGTQHVGEPLDVAVAREVLEETGLVIEVGPLIEVFDRILTDEAGEVRFHYVIADYLCRPREGRLAPGSDVSEATFVPVDALGPYRLTEKAASVIRRAVVLSGPGT